MGRSPGLAEQAGPIVVETREWLRGRPESNGSTWTALLTLVRESPGLAEQASPIVVETREWLRGRPESNGSTWTALLTLVRQLPGLAEQAGPIVAETLEWLRGRPESNETTWGAMLMLVRESPGLAEQAGPIVAETLEWLRGRPESNETTWTALLALVGQLPGLAERAEQIIWETFEWLRTRPGAHQGPWDGLILALAFSLNIDSRRRFDMLDALRQWSERHCGANSPEARGVEMLILADTHSDEIAPTVENELKYVEQNATPELVIVYPLTYAIRQMRRTDLSARLSTWARRCLEDPEADSTSYLSFIALVPGTLARPVE